MLSIASGSLRQSRALDHGQSSGRFTNPRRTGLRWMYSARACSAEGSDTFSSCPEPACQKRWSVRVAFVTVSCGQKSGECSPRYETAFSPTGRWRLDRIPRMRPRVERGSDAIK